MHTRSLLLSETYRSHERTRVVLDLTNLNDGTNIGDAFVAMNALLGDSTANGAFERYRANSIAVRATGHVEQLPRRRDR